MCVWPKLKVTLKSDHTKTDILITVRDLNKCQRCSLCSFYKISGFMSGQVSVTSFFVNFFEHSPKRYLNGQIYSEQPNTLSMTKICTLHP